MFISEDIPYRLISGESLIGEGVEALESCGFKFAKCYQKDKRVAALLVDVATGCGVFLFDDTCNPMQIFVLPAAEVVKFSMKRWLLLEHRARVAGRRDTIEKAVKCARNQRSSPHSHSGLFRTALSVAGVFNVATVAQAAPSVTKAASPYLLNLWHSACSLVTSCDPAALIHQAASAFATVASHSVSMAFRAASSVMTYRDPSWVINGVVSWGMDTYSTVLTVANQPDGWMVLGAGLAFLVAVGSTAGLIGQHFGCKAGERLRAERKAERAASQPDSPKNQHATRPGARRPSCVNQCAA